MIDRNDMQVLNNELKKTNKTILAFLKQELGLNIKYSYVKNGNSYFEGYKKLNNNNVKFEVKGINNTIVEFKFNIV